MNNNFMIVTQNIINLYVEYGVYVLGRKRLGVADELS
jgi:hypothetical protein